MVFYLSNCFLNEHMIRCFGNSVETVLHLIIFNYFTDLKPSYSLDSKTLTISLVLSVAFMMRNTSLIGWAPMFAIKMLQQKSITQYLKATFLVAVPTMSVLVAIDSHYYG